jgi:hypothetical protein
MEKLRSPHTNHEQSNVEKPINSPEILPQTHGNRREILHQNGFEGEELEKAMDDLLVDEAKFCLDMRLKSNTQRLSDTEFRMLQTMRAVETGDIHRETDLIGKVTNTVIDDIISRTLAMHDEGIADSETPVGRVIGSWADGEPVTTNPYAEMLRYKSNSDVINAIIKNTESILSVRDEETRTAFEALENEGLDKSFLFASFVGNLTSNEKFRKDNLSEMQHNTVSGFLEKYKSGNKGHTIATLMAFNGCIADMSFEENVEIWIKEIESAEKTIESLTPKNIPVGSRTSIGMEYEIMYSNSEVYSEQWSGRSLGNDIRTLAGIAGIGQGKDGVFEIATLPTDNPYLMLLEMHEIQRTGMIDFNFDKIPKGAHGYHLSIGGENNIDTVDMSFWQNALLMSG